MEVLELGRPIAVIAELTFLRDSLVPWILRGLSLFLNFFSLTQPLTSLPQSTERSPGPSDLDFDIQEDRFDYRHLEQSEGGAWQDQQLPCDRISCSFLPPEEDQTAIWTPEQKSKDDKDDDFKHAPEDSATQPFFKILALITRATCCTKCLLSWGKSRRL